MTATDKKQKSQELANQGQVLVGQAETLLQKIVLRNSRLSQEMKQTRMELEEKLTSKTK